jgi:hypothetical protein
MPNDMCGVDINPKQHLLEKASNSERSKTTPHSDDTLQADHMDLEDSSRAKEKLVGGQLGDGNDDMIGSLVAHHSLIDLVDRHVSQLDKIDIVRLLAVDPGVVRGSEE